MRHRFVSFFRSAAFWTAWAVVCVSSAAFAAPTSQPSTRPADLQVVAEMVDAYAQLERTMKATPQDRFEPAAVVELIGRDPAALAGWAKTNTDLLPYRGALRGSIGVLMDGGGNSLDRSLLLAELLQFSGYEVRLANATLPADQSRPLLSQTVVSARSTPGRAAMLSPEAQQARLRVRRHTDELIKLLGDLPAAAATAEADLIAAMSDHWWVQYRAGNGWLDLDLTGAKLVPGRTVPIGALRRGLPLDAKDCHEVDIRILIEAFRGTSLETKSVLKRTLRPAEMIGRSINFTHSIGVSLKKEVQDASGSQPDPAAVKRLKAGLIAQKMYVPALWIGDQLNTDASFTTAGEIDSSPPMNGAAKVASASAKNFGGFGGALAGETPAQAGGVLTAQWIEYEIRVPGRPAVVLRREVFDLIGPAARSAGVKSPPQLTDAQKLRRAFALLGGTQILLQPCDLSPMQVMVQLARNEINDKPMWLAVARGERDHNAAVTRALMRTSRHDLSTPLVAMMREEFGPGNGATFINAPNIIHHRRWMEEQTDGSIAARAGIDLAYTSTAASAANGFAARLEQGVADTLAEQAALGLQARPSENTMALLEPSGATVVAPTVVRTPADAAKLNLSPDALSRMSADLANGQTLVAGSVETGRWMWWRIDPRTGQTVGVMDTGFHTALTEKSINDEIADYNASLGTNMTQRSLGKASPEQIAQWASKHPNAAGCAENLTAMQKDILTLWAKRLATYF